ncbi:MAG: hypothetical protein OXC18_20290 [Desulfurellaceae bacterium]|nr:hypothetical protein [Desulfurellaceae bacterium]
MEPTKKYGDIFRENEGATRYALIDPLLVALGWDLADPTQVIPEYRPAQGKRNAVDYALMDSEGRPFMLIEAKKLGGPLNPKQLREYSKLVKENKNIAVRYGLMTSGHIWRAYDLQDNYGNNTATLDIAISHVDTVQCARDLWSLSRKRLLDGGKIEKIFLPKPEEIKMDGTADPRFN